MNRENLKTLADYLRGLPTDYGHFGMSAFFTPDDGGEGAVYTPLNPTDYLHPCGAVACAIGHGPAAGIAPKTGEEWVAYTKRAFLPDLRLLCSDWIADAEELGNEEDATVAEWGALAAWEWCFGAERAFVDDTPLGAADRIEWLLENGVPAGWEAQQNGHAPLCYRKD